MSILVKKKFNPLVSIIIPIYNGANYMREAIDSALAQTYKNIEIVVVNDGSTDDTEKIAKSYGDKIRYFAKENGGVASALNLALSEMRGEYFSWLSHDDVYLPEKIERQVDFISAYKNQDIVLYSDYVTMDDESRSGDTMRLDHEMLKVKPEYALLRSSVNGITMLIPKKAFEQYGSFDEKLKCAQDYDMWNRIMKTFKFIHIPIVLVKYRIHDKQDTRSNPNVAIEGDVLWLKMIKALSVEAKERLEGSEYDFYKEMELFLRKNSPYEKTIHFCKEKAKEILLRNMSRKDKIKIAYLIPGTGISGGLVVILQQANRLKKRGYEVFIISTNGERTMSWFPGNEVPVLNIADVEDLEGVDVLIATHFLTVRYAKKIPAKRKLYFVQSDERRFDLNVESFRECESTYQEDFEFVTMAKWIQRWLKEEFNKNAHYVPNGLDVTVFHKVKPIEKRGEKIRILMEGPIDIAFKGMDDAYEAVLGLDCELWIVSSHGKPKSDWKYDKFFEKVPFGEMKDIYSSCDILIKMSKVESFCYPPLEMMACGGVSVVRKVTGIEEYAKNGENCLIVEDVEGAKKAVQKLINDTDLRNRLIENGHKTAQQWNWDRSIDLLEKVIKKEPVEIFYTESFPERYDYNLGVKNALLDTIDKIGKERDLHQTKAEKLQEEKDLYQTKAGQLAFEIDFMRGSVFWKMRGMYLKAKKYFLKKV